MDKNKMLIDATHPEETRVVVLRNGRVEEFDFESASRKLLRGNIYLAKVTRVEPSLQAAFVEYGGNRHGFLAFNEIHPDYYQIPIADREALKQEEAEAEAAAEAEADERARRRDGRRGSRRSSSYNDRTDDGGAGRGGDRHEGDDAEAPRPIAAGSLDDDIRREEPAGDDHRSADHDDVRDARDGAPHIEEIGSGESGSHGDNGAGDPEQVEEVTTEEDALEEVPERPRRRMRQYKIQEVIKRRQIILVQVVKEERGNKGAALTTYISLAGRYTVLMPNTGRGGGISRKITQPQDRKRLKAIAEELEVSEGMGLIIRTAGASRTMQEVKRDYEYLLRLWESVRDMTLSSTAPCLVYEEGNLIKRSIRDLYSKDISDIQVAGDGAYREAREFMGMLMPGHVDDVVRYEATDPLFTRFGIERQLAAMFNPTVTLRSGGYIVINQTEALVAIDVNSGKSTREYSIEETALNTNLEASDEVARQLKLRDLAGLIVVDFIDMEEKRNNRKVEHRMKDALRHDRARIQVGRISHFGLLEMSRQRLRTGVIEGSTSKCPHCEGTGIVRATESVALVVLRSLEDQLNKQPSSLVVSTSAAAALYILNNKRAFISEMERRYGVSIAIEASDRMHGASFAIERTSTPENAKPVPRAAVSMDWGFDGEDAEGPRPEARPEARPESRPEGRLEVRPEARPEARDGARKDRERSRDRDRGHEDDERGSDRDPSADRDPPRAARDDGEGGDGEERGRKRRRRRGRRDREGDDSRPQAARGAPHEHAPTDREAGSPDPRDGNDERGASDWRGGRDGVAARDSERPSREARPIEHDEAPAAADSGEDRPGRGEGEGERTVGRPDDEHGDRAPRGRRRGRRGGRARGRDGDGGPGPREHGGREAGADRDWGLVEVARPGAEQPAGNARQSHPERPHDPIVAEGGPAPYRGDDAAARPAFVEPAIVEPVFVETVRPEATRRGESSAPHRFVDVVVEPAAPSQPRPSYEREPAPVMPPPVEDPSRPTRKGWWQRRFGGGD